MNYAEYDMCKDFLKGDIDLEELIKRLLFRRKEIRDAAMKKQKWYSERIDEDNGKIQYEAHEVKGDGFVVFQGANAKADCDRFILAA